MSGTQRSETNNMIAGQENNINRGLQDLFNAYNSGTSMFHGLGPNALSDMTRAGQGMLFSQGSANTMGNMGMGYLGNALNQTRPDLMGGSAGANMAISGLAPGMDQLAQTAGGAFLNANPYLDATFNNAARMAANQYQDTVIPELDAAFSAAGRTGSGQRALARGRAAEGFQQQMRGLANDIYGGNYQAERQRQLAAAGQLQSGGLAGIGALGNLYGLVSGDMRGAAGMIPGLNNVGLTNAQAAMQAGMLTDAQNERERQFGIDRFNADNPFARAQRLLAMSQGQYGGSAEQTYQHGFGDYLSMILGAGSTAAGAYFGAKK